MGCRDGDASLRAQSEEFPRRHRTWVRSSEELTTVRPSAAAGAAPARLSRRWGCVSSSAACWLAHLLALTSVHVEEAPHGKHQEHEEVEGRDSASKRQCVAGIEVADGLLVAQRVE